MIKLEDLPNEILDKIIESLDKDKKNFSVVNKRFFNLTKDKIFKTIIIDLSKEIKFNKFQHFKQNNLKIIYSNIEDLKKEDFNRDELLEKITKIQKFNNFETIFIQIDLFRHKNFKPNFTIENFTQSAFIIYNIFKLIINNSKQNETLKNVYLETGRGPANKKTCAPLAFPREDEDNYFETIFFDTLLNRFNIKKNIDRFFFTGSENCFVYARSLKQIIYHFETSKIFVTKQKFKFTNFFEDISRYNFKKNKPNKILYNPLDEIKIIQIFTHVFIPIIFTDLEKQLFKNLESFVFFFKCSSTYIHEFQNFHHGQLDRARFEFKYIVDRTFDFSQLKLSYFLDENFDVKTLDEVFTLKL